MLLNEPTIVTIIFTVALAFFPTLEIHPINIKIQGLKETSKELDYAQTKEVIILKAAKVYLAFPNESPLSR